MWTGYVAHGRFSSTFETGKWLFDVSVDDVPNLWPSMLEAVRVGAIPAAKRSGPRLDDLLKGKAILLAYAPARDPETARRTLEALRGCGLTGPARFKCDAATILGRDEESYLSGDFETPYAPPPGTPARNAFLGLSDGSKARMALPARMSDGSPGAVVLRISDARRCENLARVPASEMTVLEEPEG